MKTEDGIEMLFGGLDIWILINFFLKYRVIGTSSHYVNISLDISQSVGVFWSLDFDRLDGLDRHVTDR